MSTFDAHDPDWDDWDDYGAGADYEPAIVTCPECGRDRYVDGGDTPPCPHCGARVWW